jgi:phage terminase large subunit-like protein
LRFVARSRHSGRGFTGDRVILNEAYNLSDKTLAALLPTMSARSVTGNPQLWYVSSAPLNTVESAVLRRLCRRGRRGSSGLAYIEYSARPDSDLDDRQAWAAANPSFGVRISESFIEAERGAMSDEDFARERLGIWSDEEEDGVWVIPELSWRACTHPRHRPSGPLRYALDVDENAKGEQWASIGCSDGVHVELVTPPGVGAGTAWVVPACVEKRDVVGELLVAKDGQAASLVGELEDAGIPVRLVKPEEFVQASMQFHDAAIQGTLRHIDQPALNAAVAGAVPRDVGDGQWRLSRKRSQVDIGPFCAVTIARWGATVERESAYESEGLKVLG